MNSLQPLARGLAGERDICYRADSLINVALYRSVDFLHACCDISAFFRHENVRCLDTMLMLIYYFSYVRGYAKTLEIINEFVEPHKKLVTLIIFTLIEETFERGCYPGASDHSAAFHQ